MKPIIHKEVKLDDGSTLVLEYPYKVKVIEKLQITSKEK